VISLPLISKYNKTSTSCFKRKRGKNDKHRKNIAYRNALKASRTHENNNKNLK
jgi:hypothetical protein